MSRTGTSDVPATEGFSHPGTHPTNRVRPILPALGGLALIVEPLLLSGGGFTSPPQADTSDAAYIASLAADPAQTALSAGLFHYGWVALALGALAAVTLVRGNRGRVLTSVGSVLAAFGAIQMSGLLLSDHFLMSAGRAVSIDDAVAVFTGMQDGWVAVWLGSGQLLALLGPTIMLFGLARAGVIRGWLAPLPLLGFLFSMLGVTGAGYLGLALSLPIAFVGVRLVQRANTRVWQAEVSAPA